MAEEKFKLELTENQLYVLSITLFFTIQRLKCYEKPANELLDRIKECERISEKLNKLKKNNG